jgi:hypothetical protein
MPAPITATLIASFLEQILKRLRVTVGSRQAVALPALDPPPGWQFAARVRPCPERVCSASSSSSDLRMLRYPSGPPPRSDAESPAHLGPQICRGLLGYARLGTSVPAPARAAR